MKKTLAVLSAIAMVASVQADVANVSVTDGTVNDYGQTSGIAIDFDATTGLTADWGPDLTNGQAYRVDSVSLFLGAQGTLDESLYLGIYTGYVAGALSGFQGVSDNTFNLSTAGVDTNLVWTFSSAAPEVVPELNPGAGGDIFYFILQTGTGALADVTETASGTRPFRRIDGTGARFNDELCSVIHAPNALPAARALEYEAQLTVIPEPATLGMVALFGGGILFIRRRRLMI